MINYFSPSVILHELLEFYSNDEIANKIGCSDFSKLTRDNLELLDSFWEEHVILHSKKVSMKEMETNVNDRKTMLVSTPDGFQLVTSFFVKQPRQLVEIKTDFHKMVCSEDHLVQLANDEGIFWSYAKDVDQQEIYTQNGCEVANIKFLDRKEPVFDFEVAHHNHRYWGGDGISSHNSGKSFIASNLALQAQKDGYHVLYLDSEHAIDVDYLKKIGVDVSEDCLTYLSVATIEDVNSVLSEFFNGYVKAYGKDSTTAPKTLIILDSLAMLSSATEMENYDKGGIIKSDQGILAKRRKAMLRLATGHLGRLPIGMIVTDHVYPQDIMMGDGAWAITNSTKFSSSIIGIVTKLKLKEEGEITGVRMRFETYKSRFAKLGTKVELEVPYNKGMSSFSGLLPLLEGMGVIAKGTKPGEKLLWVSEWTDSDGEIHEVKFKEKDLTDQIVQQLLNHPACVATIAAPAEKEEANIDDDDTVDIND